MTPPSGPPVEDIASHCPREVTHRVWDFPGRGRATRTLCPPRVARGCSTGVQGLPLVRAAVVHVRVEGDALLLPEAPPVRRTLLGSERREGGSRRNSARQRHFCPGRAGSGHSRRGGLSVLPLSLSPERGQAEGQPPPLRRPRVLAGLALRAGPAHLPAAPAFPGRLRCWPCARPAPSARGPSAWPRPRPRCTA